MAQPAVAPDRPADAEPSKSARTRERILDAAAEVLATRGYAGTRLVDIAEVAQLQAPAIYYYWKSREDLLREVMLTGQERTTEHVMSAVRALPRDASALDRISTAAAAHLELVLRDSLYTKAATRNAGQMPAAIRGDQLDLERQYGAFWRTLIDDGVLRGEIREELEPRAARMLVLGALNWAAEWWDPERGSLSETVDTAVNFVRHALAASEADARATPSRPAGVPEA